jgi:hypothetical protein
MWIVLNNAFLSIVAANDKPDEFMVRARLRGDIEAVFGDVFEVTSSKARDYRFRALIPRKIVAAVIADQVMAIDYGNFKNSVTDEQRHDDYFRIWQVMHVAQQRETAREEDTAAVLRTEGCYGEVHEIFNVPRKHRKRK